MVQPHNFFLLVFFLQQAAAAALASILPTTVMLLQVQWVCLALASAAWKTWSAPWYTLWLHGPEWLGGWEGKHASDMCAATTKMPASDFLHEAAQAASCAALLDRMWTARLLGITTVAGACLCLVAAWVVYMAVWRGTVVQPCLRELADTRAAVQALQNALVAACASTLTAAASSPAAAHSRWHAAARNAPNPPVFLLPQHKNSPVRATENTNMQDTCVLTPALGKSPCRSPWRALGVSNYVFTQHATATPAPQMRDKAAWQHLRPCAP